MSGAQFWKGFGKYFVDFPRLTDESLSAVPSEDQFLTSYTGIGYEVYHETLQTMIEWSGSSIVSWYGDAVRDFRVARCVTSHRVKVSHRCHIVWQYHRVTSVTYSVTWCHNVSGELCCCQTHDNWYSLTNKETKIKTRQSKTSQTPI